MSFCVLIPARLASTRLPRKVMLDVGGLPMIEQVRRRALESGASRVVVAADHPEIVECIQGYGGEAVLTSTAHVCGTERLAEAARLLELPAEAIIVNLQGDEPGMNPALLQATAKLLLEDTGLQMATAAVPIAHWDDLADPHVVKLIRNDLGHAQYFSRAPIPWYREQFPLRAGEPLPDSGNWWRHLGLYAYRHGFLQDYAQWPASALEQIESLEQMRALERGVQIAVYCAAEAPASGVDTAADLERVRTLFS
jgi:3-deoxy-manno-octulosonate cytidylyltransferase (CMP-KDO synthetase)